MRTLLKISMSVKKGNEAIKGGTLQQTIQATMQALKPEAAYFFPDAETGQRTALFVFDMEGSLQMPRYWSRCFKTSAHPFVSRP